MATNPIRDPVVLDAVLSDEKLLELLALGTEYPTLDYKASVELTTTEGAVELAKDVGAMQVLGGYIIVGVDANGQPTGGLDDADLRLFDEANLAPKLRKYLPEPLEVRTRIITRDDHPIALIYVAPHPSGLAVFVADGKYDKAGKEVVRFRKGDIYWRDGTRSVRMSQQGFERIVARRIAAAKTDWMEEQHEIRRREQTDLQNAYDARRTADAPLGSVNLDLDISTLAAAVLELARADDGVAFKHLLLEATSHARALIDADQIEAELAELLDKMTCMAAAFLVYGQTDWFNKTVAALTEIFTLGFGTEPNDQLYGYSPEIPATDRGPRAWLLIISRVYALGALAVRLRDWQAVRTLTLQRPMKVTEYYGTWLRFTLTMASRARHLTEKRDGRDIEIGLLSRARADTNHLRCVNPAGVDSDQLLTSLAQFDLLAGIVAIDDAATTDDRVHFPNFGLVRQSRVQPVADLLVSDKSMRSIVITGDDVALAVALDAVGKLAARVGFRFDGFDEWDGTAVGKFIQANLPAPSDHA